MKKGQKRGIWGVRCPLNLHNNTISSIWALIYINKNPTKLPIFNSPYLWEIYESYPCLKILFGLSDKQKTSLAHLPIFRSDKLSLLSKFYRKLKLTFDSKDKIFTEIAVSKHLLSLQIHIFLQKNVKQWLKSVKINFFKFY